MKRKLFNKKTYGLMQEMTTLLVTPKMFVFNVKLQRTKNLLLTNSKSYKKKEIAMIT